MTDRWIRRSTPDDMDAMAALNDEAFGLAFKSKDKSRIVRQLHADGDSLLSLVALENEAVIGHIQFFRILIDGAPLGAGLGPMCAKPGLQKTGIGSGLVRLGLTALEGAGETTVFVLGHPAYYPKFGFTPEAVQPFACRWSGPHFMARRLAEGGPASGALTYPAAFGT